MASATPDKITFEHPLNEKMRTLLRLEHLFRQVNHYLPNADTWSSRSAIDALLDMVNIFSRADIKADLIKELDRQREKLAGIRRNPGVDAERLDIILEELAKATDRIFSIDGQIGHVMRTNEFLKSILQRSSIPGGSCAFDLPHYHFWLEQPIEFRQAETKAWLHTLQPVESAVELLLSLIRNSTSPTDELASGGFFQCNIDPQAPAQLVRVSLPREIQLFAEISGGKHRFTVRFLEPTEVDRPTQTRVDVPFSLNTCIL
ncbi:MAG: cell division protein ZapD [Chromatiaceae bacterium]|nr:cell division protein ZapD [Gammaproteobacteria bacterium]MCB1881709.1 cell division protein ZapD [Gammaproteobacteria bacterium]MCP5427322.1 cell division protein ZapD [Chromatiaceae bacterium]MCP5447841.1 cell division protein ZapD [Chromatiaceae bacterium]